MTMTHTLSYINHVYPYNSCIEQCNANIIYISQLMIKVNYELLVNTSMQLSYCIKSECKQIIPEAQLLFKMELVCFLCIIISSVEHGSCVSTAYPLYMIICPAFQIWKMRQLPFMDDMCFLFSAWASAQIMGFSGPGLFYYHIYI